MSETDTPAGGDGGRARRSSRRRARRIVYRTMPGDVIARHRAWQQGVEDPWQVARAYEMQFYELCRARGVRATVVSGVDERRRVDDGLFTLVHRPLALRRARGLRYHLGQTWSGLRLVATALAARADVVLVSCDVHWFVLALLPRAGIAVVPVLHTTLWPARGRVPTGQRLFLRLARGLFARRALAVLAISSGVAAQVARVAGGRPRPIVEFRPTYPPDAFAGIAPPRPHPAPFRVLFSGRIEAEKGVFDLVEIARRLAAAGRDDIVFDVCGTGSALPALRDAACAAGVAAQLRCHGYCGRAAMRTAFAAADVVIVPTRSDALEGAPKALIEGVLAGRPVIASRVCPALAEVAAAAVAVAPDDVGGYCDAVLRLCDDRAFYEARRQACLGLQAPYYDPAWSWGAALRHVLDAHDAGCDPAPLRRS